MFIFLCVFLLFHLTIGNKIRSIEKEIENLSSKENLEFIKSKLRNEMKDAIEKDRYLNQEDAALIGSFINKIQQELSLQK